MTLFARSKMQIYLPVIKCKSGFIEFCKICYDFTFYFNFIIILLSSLYSNAEILCKYVGTYLFVCKKYLSSEESNR